jgi:hypothetical protein
VIDIDPVPLAALQHWAYCPRQCGLIHLEQAFEDNLHTARGQAVHHLVDTPGYEMKAGVKVERALPFLHTYAKLPIGSFAAGFLLHRGWFRLELAPEARAFLSTG